MVIPLNRGAASVSQEIIAIKGKDDQPSSKVGICYSISENEASQHCIARIVNVDITSY
jgi:hypothetical protein